MKVQAPNPAEFTPTLQTHQALERFFLAHPVCRQLCIAPTLIAPHWVDFKLVDVLAQRDLYERMDSAVIAMTVEVAASLLAAAAVPSTHQWHVATTQIEHEPPGPASHGVLRVSATLDQMQGAWSDVGDKKVLVVISSADTGLQRACAFVYISVRKASF